MSRTKEPTDSQRIRILEDEIKTMRTILVNQIDKIEEILGITGCCEKEPVITIDKRTKNAKRLH